MIYERQDKIFLNYDYRRITLNICFLKAAEIWEMKLQAAGGRQLSCGFIMCQAKWINLNQGFLVQA